MFRTNRKLFLFDKCSLVPVLMRQTAERGNLHRYAIVLQDASNTRECPKALLLIMHEQFNLNKLRNCSFIKHDML
jgi:hypothetical protein